MDTTRHALHGVAELVLAGPQYGRSGTIRLLVRPGGFGTSAGPELRLDGTDLVTDAARIPVSGRSCAELAAAAGVDVGAPDGLYHDGSGVRPEEILDVDPAAAAWLARCFTAGDAALRRLAPEQTPILWPEHFDVGIQVDGVGYGVSPGDGFLAEPYAYLSVTDPGQDAFWNAPFGAARPMRALAAADPDAVLAYFAEGRDRRVAARR